jgi:TolB-like protein
MKSLKYAFTLGLILLAAGCAGRRSTVFIHPEYDFAAVERVAVVSFENLSADQGVAGYSTRLFLTELLAAQVFDVVEPGETARIIRNIGQVRGEMDLAGLKMMSDSLGVQAVIFGSVGEAGQSSGRGIQSSVVSLNARMVDCETGNTVWSSVVSIGGPGTFSSYDGCWRSDAE